MEGRSGRMCWEDGGDGRWDVLDFLEEQKFFDEPVEIGSVGGDIREEVQRLVLNFVELSVSDDEEGFKKEASWWGGDVMVEEGRCWGENVLTWGERVLNGGGRGVEVGLVGWTYFRPSRGSDRGDDSGIGVGGVVES